jgi:lipopolysaccharide assembly outer membrane protein LptD (OstA)
LAPAVRGRRSAVRPGDQQFQRYAIGARYVPKPGKVLNATYSYNSDAAIPINQVDLSGQWPINSRWQAVGRYNYSFINSLPVEIIGGLEYNAGCWAYVRWPTGFRPPRPTRRHSSSCNWN